MNKKSKLPSNEIVQALLGYKRVFRTIGIFSMLINLLMLVPSLYMLQVYDRVLPSRNGVTLAMLTLMMLGMYGLSSALEYVRSFIVIRIGAKLDMHLNARVYTAAFETNLKQQGVNAGQSLNDLTTIRQFVTGNALSDAARYHASMSPGKADSADVRSFRSKRYAPYSTSRSHVSNGRPARWC